MGRNLPSINPPEERPEESPLQEIEEIVQVAADSAALSAAPSTAVPSRSSLLWRRLRRLVARRVGLWVIVAALGPGLIAANAGNDAGGIATYASVGARYGYSLLWVIPLIAVSLAVVQEMAARMGAATGKGLSDLIRENFPIHVTAFVLLALLISNGATAVSEFVGIEAAVSLVAPPLVQYLAVPLIGVFLWLLVVRTNYSLAEKVFLVMTLVFFAYPISAFLARPHWSQVLHQTVFPSFSFTQGYLMIVVATVGTTITPYMQVYVQSSVVERGITRRDYLPERIEVYLGSLFAILIAAFIIIATAATLYPHPSDRIINTAADAAKALAPLAGPNAERLFAIGLFGASMLAAAIVPLATAYSITEALGLENGLNVSFRDAPVFFGLFTGLIALGVIVALTVGGRAIQVLVFLYVINGLLLPVILFSILRLINNKGLMGDMTNGPIYNVIAYLTAGVVSLLSIILLITTILGWFGVQV